MPVPIAATAQCNHITLHIYTPPYSLPKELTVRLAEMDTLTLWLWAAMAPWCKISMKVLSEVPCLLLGLLSHRVASGWCVPYLKVTPPQGCGLHTLPAPGSNAARLHSPGPGMAAALESSPRVPAIFFMVPCPPPHSVSNAL